VSTLPGDYLIHSKAHPSQAERRIKPLMEVMSEAYMEATGNDIDLTKLPMERQRLLASLGENVIAHHAAAVAAGAGESLLRASAEARQKLGLKETVTSADIVAFTTQQLAYVVDVFAPFIVQDVVSTVTMLGPTAYVHRQTFRREDACGFYSANSALVDGLDPACSECPAECDPSNGIDVEITASLVEAECRRLAGQYCIPANYHFSSQYGGNLADVLMEGITIELRRHIQAGLLALIVASAGGTHTWNRTPAAGSYWASANENEWKRQLWTVIRSANREILKDPDGRVSARILLGDVDGIGVLEDVVPLELVDQQPTNFSFGRADEMSAYLGRTKQDRFDVYRFLEGLPTDTLVLLDRNDQDPTVVFAPWIPITSMGMLTDPETGRVKIGAITLYGQTVLRPKRIRTISIGA
jgi:hypothetical protein